MWKLIFFLCAAFMIQTNAANYDNLDLEQKINATLETFGRLYSEAYGRTLRHLRLPEQNNLYRRRDDLRIRLADTFDREFRKWQKYNRQEKMGCRLLSIKANSYFNRDHLTTSCWTPAQEVINNPPLNHLLTTRSVVGSLMGLLSMAATCDGEKCDEIKKSLDDLRVNEKLFEAISMMHRGIDELFLADENLEKCLQSDKTSTQYDEDVRKATRDLSNCIVLNRQKNSSDSSGNISSVISSASNSSVLINNGVDEGPNVDLVQKASATNVRLQTEWRNFWNESRRVYGEYLKNVTEAVPHLVSELTNIFKQENESVLEYYEKRTNAEDCFSPIEELRKQIFRHDVRASKCQLLAVIDGDMLSNASSIFEDLRDDVSRVGGAAFQCRDESCIGKFQEMINGLEPKFQAFTRQLPLIIEETNLKEKNLYDCLQLDSTLKKYKEDVQQGFSTLKNCVDQKK